MAAYALQDIFYRQGSTGRSLFFGLFLITACVLIATAPIYWLPGLPLPVLTAIKNGAFFSAVGLALVISGPRFLQLRIAFPFIIAAALNFVAFQVNGSGDRAVYQALIFLAPMAWVLALRSIRRQQAATLLKYLPVPLGLIGVAVSYAFLAKFGAVPDLRPPMEGLRLGEQQIAGFQRMSVSVGGFNFGRTGWGTGTSMALVLLGSILIGRNRQWFGLAVLTLAVVAPAAMGGRGAALGAMAAFGVAVLTLRHLGSLRVFLIFMMVITPIAAIEYLANIGVLSDRFFNIQSNADLYFVIDELTTGRLTTWINAIDNFSRSPFTGVGYENSLTTRRTGEVIGVHNVWLGFLSEGGLLAFIPAIFIFIWCAKLIWNIPEFRPILVFVVFTSMVEPSVVFGTFGNQIAFWTAVGLSMNALRR